MYVFQVLLNVPKKKRNQLSTYVVVLVKLVAQAVKLHLLLYVEVHEGLTFINHVLGALAVLARRYTGAPGHGSLI